MNVRSATIAGRIRILGALFLGVLAFISIGQGSYIHVKAIVGQWLIQSAWSDSLATGISQKPWPWMDTWPMAELSIPRLEINQIVLAGDSGQALAFGPGHRTGSALPGNPGITLISGHRDTHFSFVSRLTPGDRIALTNQGNFHLDFEVTHSEVVEKSYQLSATDNENVLVLATCWPLGTTVEDADQRYLVFAKRI